jgi:DNA-binding GntR family transcriptional regulator
MPLSTPRLSYKFQRLRERIRGAIESGELAHKLPGERELARRFGVNAKTISNQQGPH